MSNVYQVTNLLLDATITIEADSRQDARRRAYDVACQSEYKDHPSNDVAYWIIKQDYHN